MTKEYMLTTIDNPWNPFTNFDDWKRFDDEKGYNTYCLLAAYMPDYGDDRTEEEERRYMENTIDDIVMDDPLGVYIKVAEDNFDRIKSFLKQNAIESA